MGRKSDRMNATTKVRARQVNNSDSKVRARLVNLSCSSVE